MLIQAFLHNIVESIWYKLSFDQYARSAVFQERAHLNLHNCIVLALGESEERQL